MSEGKERPPVARPAGDGQAGAAGNRSVLWGILCAVGGWVIFSAAFLYGVVVLAFSGYVLNMPAGTSEGYSWGTLFSALGLGVAMLGMLVAPVILGMALVKRSRPHWIAGIIFAVPAVAGAIVLYTSIFIGLTTP